MKNDYPYLELLRIFKECRNTLIEDTLDANSPDLYDALYSSCQNQIYKVKLELYEIKWLELCWKKITETIENKNCSLSERKEYINFFVKWYREFVNHWNYKEFDTIIFEEKINILKALVSVNNEWESNLKTLKVSFEQSKKILNEKIRLLEMEVD